VGIQQEKLTHVVMPSLADPSFILCLGVREDQLAGFDGAGSKLSLLYVTCLSNLRKN
jgi:hypothetical protein